MSRFFGVDFGTTTTGFVSFDPKSELHENIGNRDGHPFHSVIILDKITGKIFHKGLEAWKRKMQYATTEDYIVINSVKQKLCSDIKWRAGKALWTPEQISAEVLRNGTEEIKNRWNDIKVPIQAVMAVPVDFTYKERCKIVNAAKTAGIEVEQFVSEPTAAIIGCEEDLRTIQYAMVFDWGGGTLDVSVLKISDGRIRELAKKGSRTGGDNLDELFARHIHGQFRELYPTIPIFNEVGSRQKDVILTESEERKRSLSEEFNTKTTLPEYYGCSKGIEVGRQSFEEIIKIKIDEAVSLVNNTLSEANLSKDEIDLVLLVGGSSNIPVIKQKMADLFGSRCKFPKDAEWLIAKGAARLAGKRGNYVLSKSVGVVLSDNSFLPVIRQGEPIDHKEKVITLGLVEDSKEACLIIAESFSENLCVGNYQMIDALTIPTIGYNFEPIRVSFKIQTDLALNVSVYNEIKGTVTKQDNIYPHLNFEYEIAQNYG